MRRTVLLLATLTLACGPGSRGEIDNLLVLTLDTTRADRLGAYGNADAHTPNFDRFDAERAVRFEYAVSAAPITLPSHSTIFTSTYPVFHGVRDNEEYALDEEVTTLAEILAERGFTTGAFVSAVPLAAANNLDQGFETYDDDFEADWSDVDLLARTDLAFGFAERRSGQVNRAFGRWLEEHYGDRFFAWVHYFDPHQPYDLIPPYDSMFADSPYDAEIASMDESFGELLGMLEAYDLTDRTLVVIVGDHGEGLFQHDEPTHASYLYDATMRVPLWIASPAQRDRAGSTVSTMVRTLDVTPTILDLLDLPTTDEMQGRTLRPLLDGGELAPEPALMETYYSWFHYGWAPSRALNDGEWKVIEDPKPRLYHVASDPRELTDLSAAEPDRLAEMLDRLRRSMRRHASGRPDRSVAVRVDDEVAVQLRSLGYLAGGGGDPSFRVVRYPPPEELARLPDADDHAVVLLFANTAWGMVGRGRYSDATKAARAGLEIDPGNPALREYLARGLAGLGLLDESLEIVRELLRERPRQVGILRLESLLHQLRGKDDELIRTLRAIADLGVANQDDLKRLARAYQRTGEFEQAIDHYVAAERLGDPGADLLVDHANALFELGRGEAAVSKYQQALDRDPSSVRARFFAGQLYLEAGNSEFAEELFRQALELDPGHAGVRLYLARAVLANGGSQAEAAELLEGVETLAPGSQWASDAGTMLAELAG